MKNLPVISAIAIILLFVSCNKLQTDKRQTVNPIIGDRSYESKFGHMPETTTDNNLRIITHLEYVENLLRQKDVSGLSAELQAKRKYLLDLLHDYRTNGVFPGNYDYLSQRKPCFIDKNGTICAVGYLIEQTAGRKVAEEINKEHQYDELLAMNDEIVDNWIAASGLTKEECAMIQPMYGPSPVYSNNYIQPSYGISSSVFAGFNLSLSIINGIQIGNGAPGKTAAITGLITGAGQIALGSIMFPEKEGTLYGPNYTNETQKALSLVNIGLGTTTMVLSAWNLVAQKQKEKATTWNIYSFPAGGNNTGLAFSLTSKF